MNLDQKKQVREAVRLALIGAALVGVGLLTPHKGARADESLWMVARDSTWQKLGDWPAAEASLSISLLSCGAAFLVLAGRRLWTVWVLPQHFHRVLIVAQALPFFTLAAGLYYLIKALF